MVSPPLNLILYQPQGHEATAPPHPPIPVRPRPPRDRTYGAPGRPQGLPYKYRRIANRPSTGASSWPSSYRPYSNTKRAIRSSLSSSLFTGGLTPILMRVTGGPSTTQPMTPSDSTSGVSSKGSARWVYVSRSIALTKDLLKAVPGPNASKPGATKRPRTRDRDGANENGPAQDSSTRNFRKSSGRTVWSIASFRLPALAMSCDSGMSAPVRSRSAMRA